MRFTPVLVVGLSSLITFGCCTRKNESFIAIEDISNGRVTVRGRLGIPLGRVACVEGRWEERRKGTALVFVVKSVNNIPVSNSIEFEYGMLSRDEAPVGPPANHMKGFERIVSIGIPDTVTLEATDGIYPQYGLRYEIQTVFEVLESQAKQ